MIQTTATVINLGMNIRVSPNHSPAEQLNSPSRPFKRNSVVDLLTRER